jgi:hypothetical protein
VRPPLADQLIGQTSVPPLVVRDVAGRQALHVILAGKQRRVIGRAGADERGPIRRRGVGVIEQQRHLLRGAQRGQPQRAHERVVPGEIDVVGAGLDAAEHPGAVNIPGAVDVLQQAGEVGPVAT